MSGGMEKTLNRSVEASSEASPRHWAGGFEYPEKPENSRFPDRNFSPGTSTTKQN